ncbi:MAG TPA: TlpA disulfide reductase family protein [Candidatus Udaeobacter sp.]|jgi:thiol-disulfide isomerase/thioredoxin
MDSTRAHRASWKVRFLAFVVGIIVAAAVFGIALVVSDDLRLLYLSGALLLAVPAFLPGARVREDWIAGVLLLFPLMFLFAFFILPQIPLLWPTIVLWVAIVALLLFRNRLGRLIRIAGAIVLIAVSTWYCVFYIPVQMRLALAHVSNAQAPQFTLEPITRGPVPTGATVGKILVLDFFATWCSPCIAELPELERVRADLQNNREIEFVLVGTNKGGDTPERVRAFAQRRHLSLPIAFDPEQKTMHALGLSGFPTLVVIDRAGHVRLTHTGYNSSETSFRCDLTQLLQNL